MNFSAVILAGGRSQRMGRDKAWLTLHGKPLIERQIALVRELGATEIFISGRTGMDYGPLECAVLEDRFKDAGPLAGIESALSKISTPLLLVLAVDMPRMQLPPLQTLLAQCAESRGAIPRVDHRLEPLAAFYPQSALNLVTHLLENGRLAATHFGERCVELKLASLIDFPALHSGNFENWNTPSDVSEVSD
jgi:molybdopterin-guanine dinucleotide biosynthesis protein A